VAQPYSILGKEYDRSLGATLFPTVRTGFENLVSEFGLNFGSVADLGCGTGQFLSYVSRYPVRLWGVDTSTVMLCVAARRLRHSNAHLIQQDIRALRLPQAVDLIVCNGDTLNYLVAPGELDLVLGACRRNLRRGGHLVCDFLTGTPPARQLTRLARASSGRIARWRFRTAPDRRLTWVEYSLARPSATGTRWTTEVHKQRWFLPVEVLRALAVAGLRTRAVRRLDGSGDKKRAWLQVLAQTQQ
jgi:SAM-dependent methyltransferase